MTASNADPDTTTRPATGQVHTGVMSTEHRPTLATTQGAAADADELLEEIRGRIRGPVLVPGSGGYDQARVLWNGLVERRPAAIVRAASTADVVEVVGLAAAQHLLLAVRGGGHNVAGTASADGGLVLDLSDMRTVEVDAERRLVRVGGGATWADVDAATQRHRLATPGGVVSDTGVGGLTLGGGIGWLRRRHGLSCDNLVGAEVVTAAGDVLHVDDQHHPELLWGLRGGGGNFGVVTELRFTLHPVGPEVMCAFVFHHGSRTQDALRFYRRYTADLDEGVSSFAICGTVPAEDPFPADAHGEPYVLFMACHVGDVETGRRLVEPLRRFADPIVDLSEPMPYVEVQQLFDEDYPAGARYYWKSLDLETLDDEAIERIAQHAVSRPSPLSTVDVWHQGGAMARVPATATAFGDRSAGYLLGVEANWTDPADDDANVGWARRCSDDLESLSTGREYLNFPGLLEDREATLQRAHGDNYERLVALKQRYDPANLFRLHQNIDPDAAA